MTKPEETNYIDLKLMKTMCHPIAVALFDSNAEPMSRFDKHHRQLLESALHNPRQTFDGVDLYPTLPKKAAILYYSLIKNHPFDNGNKRTATATMLVFLFINQCWIAPEAATIDYLVNLARRVASSTGATDKESFLNEIELWLEKNIEEVLESEKDNKP